MRRPKAGWYPDPTSSERLRYWTGRHWTQVAINRESQRPNLDVKLINYIENYIAARGKGKSIDAVAPAAEDQASSKGPKKTYAHNNGFVADVTTFATTNPLTSILIVGIFFLFLVPEFFWLALALAGLGTVFFYFKSNSSPREVKKIEAKKIAKPAKIVYKKMADDLAKELETFSRIATSHSKLKNARMSASLNAIIENFQELFRRLDKYAVDQQKQVATVQYIDIFRKLNSALGEDYYLDIVAHPDFWEEAPERMNAVQVAVEKIEAELVNNIKKVNSSKDLEFKVALDGLMKTNGLVQPSDLLEPPAIESFWKDKRFTQVENAEVEDK